MRTVIIIDGPPAAGKTTLGLKLVRHVGGCVVNYKAFGPANIIAKAILKLSKTTSTVFAHIDSRRDPFLLFPYTFWRRSIPAITMLTILELLYKMFQQIIILLLLLLKRVIVIDEFLILRFANYINTLRLGVIDVSTFKLLYWQDICFLKLISTLANVKYIILEPDISILIRNWRKRGHRVPYDLNFLAITRYAIRTLKESIINKII